MKNFTRAQRKRAMRMVKVGDLVATENDGCRHPVLEVSMRGVVIDTTGCKYGSFPRWPVAWDGNARHGVYHEEGGKGPVFLVLPDGRIKQIE